MTPDQTRWYRFTPGEPGEADLVKCPHCGEWSPWSEWTETSVECDTCGDHDAVGCPNPDCFREVDSITDTDPLEVKRA